MYSAIRKCNLQTGNWLLIPGAGGGLGHLCVLLATTHIIIGHCWFSLSSGVQIARAQGYRVIAVDTYITPWIIYSIGRHGWWSLNSGEDKRKICLEFGAVHFIDFLTEDVCHHHPLLLAILSSRNTNRIVGVIRSHKTHISRRPRCCLLSRIHRCLPASSSMRTERRDHSLYWRQPAKSPYFSTRHGSPRYVKLSWLYTTDNTIGADDLLGLRLIGSAVGTLPEMQELFQLAARGEVKPLIMLAPFDQIDAMAKKLEKGQVNGRIVMEMPQ